MYPYLVTVGIKVTQYFFGKEQPLGSALLWSFFFNYIIGTSSKKHVKYFQCSQIESKMEL